MRWDDIWTAAPPSLSFTGPCLVVGTGRCVRDDLDRLGPWDGDVMAVNLAGIFAPRLTHWFTAHGENLPAWENARRTLYTGTWLRHGKQGGWNSDHYWPISGRYGRNSGMSAAIIASVMYEKVVLCGVPSDSTGYFYPGRLTDYDQAKHEVAWKELNERIFKGRVTSLSGNTAKWLS